MPPNKTIPEPYLTSVLRTATRHTGRPEQAVTAAYRRWSANLAPIPCTAEVKGKPYGIEDGCDCAGCWDRRFIAYFVAVRQELSGRGIP